VEPWTESLFAAVSVLGIALALAFWTVGLLLITVLGVGCLVVSDVSYTRSRRFGDKSQQTIVATTVGVRGHAYPLGWYSPDGRNQPVGHARGVVVRSRFAKLVAERAEGPNFLSWEGRQWWFSDTRD
jgi:hypothetical protein